MVPQTLQGHLTEAPAPDAAMHHAQPGHDRDDRSRSRSRGIDDSDDTFDWSHELGRVMEDQDTLAEYEANIKGQFQAELRGLCLEAEEAVSTQTALVLRSSTVDLDARRADLQREYQTAVVSHEHAMATATVQTQSSLANAAQHMESEHHVQLQAMVVQYQEAYSSNDARFQLAYANLQEHAHVMQHGLGEQVATAVQRYETSAALVSQVEHQSQLEIRCLSPSTDTITWSTFGIHVFCEVGSLWCRGDIFATYWN